MRYLLLVVVGLLPLTGMAQYKGGSDDGFSLFRSTSQNLSPAIYAGGSSDGHASMAVMQLNSSPGIYSGGSNDGYHMMQPKGIVNAAPGIYTGGPNDGFALIASADQNALPTIYAGGSNDGFDMVQPKGSVNSSPGIYAGGANDGFSLHSPRQQQNIIPPIYAGGESDGYSFTVSLRQNREGVDPHDAQRTLPLIHLSGSWFNDDAVLAWQSAQDSNGFFELLRSDDGGAHFHMVASIRAESNADPEQEYRYNDIGAYSTAPEYLLYKLKCVDKGGDARYSGVVKLSKDRTAAVIVAYPNPTSGHFTLSLLNVATPAFTAYSYALTAADGKLIRQGRVQEANTHFDLSGLASATYRLTVAKDGLRVQQFTIVLTQ
jgi:hypothetical protein